jgi:muramidase (phage lysozyme)
MARIAAEAAGGDNVCAFLDMTAWSEIGTALLARSDDGYNVLVGSTPAKPLLFKSYATHPMVRNAAMNSDAAGRYQFLGRYWPAYQDQLSLPDFGPLSQDIWAIQLIRECRALDDIKAGQLSRAIAKCNSRWASFTGSPYGQHTNTIQSLQRAYLAAGGKFEAA